MIAPTLHLQLQNPYSAKYDIIKTYVAWYNETKKYTELVVHMVYERWQESLITSKP